MDISFRSPLLDFFRRGDVPLDIRLLAAQGVLAPRAHEQLALLLLLSGDHDPQVVEAAERTLAAIPREPLIAFLAQTDVAAEIRTFFAARGIEPGNREVVASQTGDDADAPLIDVAPEPAPAVASESLPESSSEPPQTTLQRIAAMTVAQRVALAMKGSREERAVLIRDPNKLVGVAVLSSPKMTETEVESVAKMATLSEELLRVIAGNRAWTKRYGIIAALVRNPKTPVAISMNLLARLSERDLRSLSSDRNVPEVLRITARQKLVLNR